MGGKSSSSSSSNQTTNNSSVSFGIQGDNEGIILNGDGNSIIDGGAFDVIGRFVELLPDIFTSQLDTVSGISDNMAEQNIAFVENNAETLQQFGELGTELFTQSTEFAENTIQDSFKFGEQALDMGERLADKTIDANALVTEQAIAGNVDLTELVIGAIQNANDGNIELAGDAMAGAQALAEANMNYASNLATDITESSLDSVSEAQQSAFVSLADGYESMLGFAEQYSRSDGAALAESNSKTMLMLVGGLALTGIVVALIIKKA